jgi:shikimate kinase/3-dehydroquinate synthase
MSLFLIGMPGAGKSFIGKKLSEFFNIDYYDTDAIVEKRYGKPIANIFSEHGEEYFRKLETRALESCLSLDDDFICSTGGGIIENYDNFLRLKSKNTVYVKKESDELLKHVNKNKGKRPLLLGSSEEKLKRLFERREYLFEQFPFVSLPIGDFESKDLSLLIYSIYKHYPSFVKSEEILLKGRHDIVFSPLKALEIINKECDHVFLSDTVESIYGSFLSEKKKFVLPDGEAAKTSEMLNKSWDYLIKNGVVRSDTIFGFGGGTVTDLTGFAASTFKRGISFKFVPTTLLAQVDAAIGGKNAVNIGGVKNICGTFSFPEKVYIDSLITLSSGRKELMNGIVEALKVALVAHSSEVILKNQLERARKILNNPDLESLNSFVLQAIKDKMKIVNEDPYEKGTRKFLNLGHTYGHVYETTYNLPHGEAVALGIIKKLGVSDYPIINDYISFFVEMFGEDIILIEKEWTDEMKNKLFNDKKNSKESVVFINLKEPGMPFIESVEKDKF